MEKLKNVYRFVSQFDHTIIFQGSRYDVVYDAMQKPIAKKSVPAVKLVFTNKFAETDDPTIVELMQNHKEWGSMVFWAPESVPSDLGIDGKKKSDTIMSAAMETADKKRKGVMSAREGSVERES